MNLKNSMKYKRIHMIGIGGSSMSGIAKIIASYGMIVTGSDQVESSTTKELRQLGMDIQVPTNEEGVKKADLIVYSAAIKQTDPDRLLGTSLKIPEMERAEFLGLLTKEFENTICVSGTHGKSTTSSMLSSVFLEANLDPTIQIGAILDSINGNSRVGKSSYFIIEACEYVDSFLHFHPKTEIILNIDDDHLDYFKNMENIKKSFHKYMKLLKEKDFVILNKDDKNTMEASQDITCQKITFAIKEEADYNAKNIQYKEGIPTFDVYEKGVLLDTFTLGVLGIHNVSNALAVIATCRLYKIPLEYIKKGLLSYHGVKRRFEKIGYFKSCPVYDDYAHHPTEIETTLKQAQSLPHKRLIAIFEPHTFSRTKAHLQEFAKILSQFDKVLLPDIYPAREIDDGSISSKDLERQINTIQSVAKYFPSYEAIIKECTSHTQEGDIILCIGAGTVNKIGYQLTQKKY